MSQTMPQSHYDCPCMEKCPLHHAMQLIGVITENLPYNKA